MPMVNALWQSFALLVILALVALLFWDDLRQVQRGHARRMAFFAFLLLCIAGVVQGSAGAPWGLVVLVIAAPAYAFTHRSSVTQTIDR